MRTRGSTRCRATSAVAALVLLGAFAGPGSASGATLLPSVKPTATFTASTTRPRVGDTVRFTSTASAAVGDTIDREDWDFGDGSTASGHAPTHTYTTPGAKTVKLTVTNAIVPPATTAEFATSSQTINVVANQLPRASFTVSPSAPLPGQTVTFRSTSTDSDGTIVSQAWDLDNNGAFNDGTVATVTRSFPTSGPHTVRLEVTDDLGGKSQTAVNVVVNVNPTASFTFSPGKPIAGDTVKFDSTSTDSDGTIARVQWDLDGDGAYDDATGDTAQRTFSVAGDNVVGVRVTDDRGGVATKTTTVTVIPNKVPNAAFTYAPTAPTTGEVATFTSTSKDSDGSIAKQEWDLDGDGQFDDALGSTARRGFDPGQHRVSLRVTDNRGATDTAFQTFTVREAAKPASAPSSFGSSGPAAPPRTGPALLSPFPVVSLRGRLVRGGAIIEALEVLQLQFGARVEVRCLHRGCPFRTKVRTAGTKGSKRRVRFRQIEHRLRAGVIIQVYITRPGLIGKFTSFRIRRSATPVRKDRCLLPGARRPTRCAR